MKHLLWLLIPLFGLLAVAASAHLRVMGGGGVTIIMNPAGVACSNSSLSLNLCASTSTSGLVL